MTPARIRLALLAAAVIAIFAIVIVALSGGSGGGPPATGAASLVPASTLAYVNVSTDSSRPAVKQALDVASRLPGYAVLEAEVGAKLTQIAGGGSSAVDYASDIRPWLGDEAALALLNTSTSTAGSLVVLAVRDPARARAFLTTAGATSAGSYRGVRLYGYPSSVTQLAFLRSYLVFGQAASVRAAIDVDTGHGQSLAASSAYQSAAAGEPADRVLDVYASAAGVRRLLVPQSGVGGAVGALLNQPALTGLTISLSGSGRGASVRIHSALDRRLLLPGGGLSPAFEPTLDRVFPSGSLLMFDTTGLNLIASRLLKAGATAGVVGELGPLLSKLGQALNAEGVDVQAVEALFSGETAVGIGRGSTTAGTSKSRSPELLIVTRTSNQADAARQLANLEVPLSELFPAPSSGSGAVPEFNTVTAGAATAHQLSLEPGLEFDYAVFNGLIVISTSLDGIAAVASHAHALSDEPAYAATLPSHPNRITSLVFLDFSQLLNLAEQTGLFRGAHFSALRPDLEKVRAAGLVSTRGEADSTAELFLQIP
jgi:hypothetical protein